MSDNPVTCGNCKTENDPGADTCANCGQPLTRSAEEGIVANEEAQSHGSILGGTSSIQPGTSNTYVPNTDTPSNDGLPTD